MADSRRRRLVLLRHGRTAWNRIDRAQGHADVALDEVGQHQAKQAAAALAELDPVLLWTSDLVRARQTAAQLEEATGLVARPDPRLREYDLGIRTGLTRPEFAATHPEVYQAWLAGADGPRVEGEEHHDDVRRRMVPALQEMLAALGDGETGIVVSHGACLKATLPRLLGWEAVNPATIVGMDNCAWAVVVRASPELPARLAAYNVSV
ncbi:MAG: histidine phosphatase family protein [Marmoricola sp.]